MHHSCNCIVQLCFGLRRLNWCIHSAMVVGNLDFWATVIVLIPLGAILKLENVKDLLEEISIKALLNSDNVNFD